MRFTKMPTHLWTFKKHAAQIRNGKNRHGGDYFFDRGAQNFSLDN